MHANRFLWARLMDVLLSLPVSPPPPVFPSPSPRTATAARLERIHIAFGNPRWTALAEVPYVLGVVAALDWEPVDELVGRHWPQANVRTSPQQLTTKMSLQQQAGTKTVALRQTETRLELSIAARPSSRAQVERAVLGHVSARVQRVLEFVRGE